MREGGWSRSDKSEDKRGGVLQVSSGGEEGIRGARGNVQREVTRVTEEQGERKHNRVITKFVPWKVGNKVWLEGKNLHL